MSDTYIIEVASQTAGIVVRDTDGYRFFAATHRFNPLEGQLFRNAREAELAASRLDDGRRDAGRVVRLPPTSGLVIDGLKAIDRRWNALAARLQLQGKELRIMARLMQIAAVEP